jgi:hypothetical protein
MSMDHGSLTLSVNWAEGVGFFDLLDLLSSNRIRFHCEGIYHFSPIGEDWEQIWENPTSVETEFWNGVNDRIEKGQNVSFRIYGFDDSVEHDGATVLFFAPNKFLIALDCSRKIVGTEVVDASFYLQKFVPSFKKISDETLLEWEQSIS